MHHIVPRRFYQLDGRRASDARKYPENAQNDEEHDLKEMPISIIGDLEQHQLSSPERIHSLIDTRISS